MQKNLFQIYLNKNGLQKWSHLKKFKLVFWKFTWQDNINIHDCGICAMRYMETFRGGRVQDEKPSFDTSKIDPTY